MSEKLENLQIWKMTSLMKLGRVAERAFELSEQLCAFVKQINAWNNTATLPL